MTDFLKVYTEYINNYNDSLAVLNECKKNKAFVSFVTKLSSASQNKLDLASYLIQPIQRIPRYNLLLDDLIKHTPKDHADHADLLSALAKIKHIAAFLNENARLEMNKSKITSIQDSIFGNNGDLVGWNRTFVREGKIKVDGKSVFVFLFSDMLIITKPARGGKHEFLKKYVFKNVDVSPDKGNSFKIQTSEGDTFISVLSWDNPMDMDSWLEEFKKLSAHK